MLAVVGNIVIYQWLRLASVTENWIDRTTAGNPAGVEFSPRTGSIEDFRDFVNSSRFFETDK